MRNKVNPLQKQIKIIVIIPMKRVFLWKQLRKSHRIILTHLKAISQFLVVIPVKCQKPNFLLTNRGIQTPTESSLMLREHFKNAKDLTLSSCLFKRTFKALNLQQVEVSGNGYCFLSSILIALGEAGMKNF